MLRKILNCYNVQIFKHLRDKACHLESVKNGGFQWHTPSRFLEKKHAQRKEIEV